MSIPVGTILDGRFEIGQILGAGNFGAVYRARQLVFGRHCRDIALKLFKIGAVTPENAGEVFQDALTLMHLQEQQAPPDIARRFIQVYEIGTFKEPANQSFMAMRLVNNGRDLEGEITRAKSVGGMRARPSLEIIKGILIPLAWMHTLDKPLVHGDIKPDNILLDEEGNPVLVDFGLATRLPLGSVGGAIIYQSPENVNQVLGQAPSDIYAIGLTWYEMLTGRHPFAAVGLAALAAEDQPKYVEEQRQARKWPIRHDAETGAVGVIPAVSTLNPQIKDDPQVEQMVHRCLAYNPSDRYPNARILLQDVNQYLEQRVISGPRHAPAPPPLQTAAPAAFSSEKTAAQLLGDAKTFLAAGQIAEAEARTAAALMKEPRSVAGRCVRAQVLMKSGAFAEARKLCAQARQSAPNERLVWETMAELYQVLGATDTAAALRGKAQKLKNSIS